MKRPLSHLFAGVVLIFILGASRSFGANPLFFGTLEVYEVQRSVFNPLRKDSVTGPGEFYEPFKRVATKAKLSKSPEVVAPLGASRSSGTGTGVKMTLSPTEVTDQGIKALLSIQVGRTGLVTTVTAKDGQPTFLDTVDGDKPDTIRVIFIRLTVKK